MNTSAFRRKMMYRISKYNYGNTIPYFTGIINCFGNNYIGEVFKFNHNNSNNLYSNYLNLIILLNQIYKNIFSSHNYQLIDKFVSNAIIHNDLRLFKWLHNSVQFTLNKKNAINEFDSLHPIDIAAIHGNFDIVKFICEHRHEGCTYFVLTEAYRHKRYDIMDYLSNRYESLKLYLKLNGFEKYIENGQIKFRNKWF